MSTLSADEKPALGRTRVLTDSTVKRNKKEVLANYNKTRISIVHRYDRWTEIKETLRA